MKVIVISDAHLYKMDDGSYWCNTAVHGYDFWKRYTDTFDMVLVAARVMPITDNNGYVRADGPCVEIKELPFVRGVSQYVLNFKKVCRVIKKMISDEDAAIFRVPSLPAYIMLHYYRKMGRPYSLEVVVDPIDCYANNKIAQRIMTYITKKACLSANGVSYVTQHFLENRYPCQAILYGEDKEHFTSYYSSIDLSESFFCAPRVYKTLSKIRIIHVASIINDEVKGHETLIKAAELLIKQGLDIHVDFVGDGLMIPKYKKYIKDNNLEDNIVFLGLFSSKEQIREFLINSDMFVFPTKAEGLPRVLIEAMATGLPCLSTPVNGIPELLDKEYMFAPNDVEGFSNKIKELMNKPDELTSMSKKNIETASRYTNNVLKVRRNEFYTKLLNLCKEG